MSVRVPRLPRVTSLWIGTYPEAGAGTPVGQGEGVWSVELDDETGALTDARLVTTLPAPSFLAARPTSADGGPARLYAALEDEAGRVAGLVRAPSGDVEVDTAVPSGGAYPCHLLPTEHALLVANYGSGTLGVLPLDADGALTGDPDVHGHTGHGPRADRQEGPHAHFVVLAPGGRHVLVVDLGTDQVRRYAWDGRTATPDGVAVTLPPGTGPRHVAFSADARTAYLVGELDVALHVLTWDEASATGELVQSVPAVVDDPRTARTEPSAPADAATASTVAAGAPVDAAALDEAGAPTVTEGAVGDLPSHVVADGDEVLVAVRGADVLTRWRTSADGRLTDGRSFPLGGSWPRHFAVVGRWVVVALERAHELVVLDRRTLSAAGSPSIAPTDPVVARLRMPSPTCILPA